MSCCLTHIINNVKLVSSYKQNLTFKTLKKINFPVQMQKANLFTRLQSLQSYLIQDEHKKSMKIQVGSLADINMPKHHLVKVSKQYITTSFLP